MASVSSSTPPPVRSLVRPTSDEQGRIELASLDEVSSDALGQWMRARFEGRDPYWGIDRDGMEPPDEIFVDLWQRADAGGSLRGKLGKACGELLPYAWESQAQPWVEWLLQLVAVVRPASCGPFLVTIARRHDFSPEVIDANLDLRWLAAAGAFSCQPAELIPVWEELLSNPRYHALAYRALANDLDLGIFHLARYYEQLSEGERPLLLKEAVRDLLRFRTNMVLGRLLYYRRKIQRVRGLQEAIDVALHDFGCPPAFSAAPSYCPSAGQTGADAMRSKLRGLAARELAVA